MITRILWTILTASILCSNTVKSAAAEETKHVGVDSPISFCLSPSPSPRSARGEEGQNRSPSCYAVSSVGSPAAADDDAPYDSESPPSLSLTDSEARLDGILASKDLTALLAETYEEQGVFLFSLAFEGRAYNKSFYAYLGFQQLLAEIDTRMHGKIPGYSAWELLTNLSAFFRLLATKDPTLMEEFSRKAKFYEDIASLYEEPDEGYEAPAAPAAESKKDEEDTGVVPPLKPTPLSLWHDAAAASAALGFPRC